MIIHDRLWKDMIQIGIPTHIIHLLMNVYREQKAKVRTKYGDSEWFPIEKGVKQGTTISPHLFNIYSERVMREALEGLKGTVKVGGKSITNLRYAEDVVLIASTIEELQDLVDRVKESSARVGLSMNVKKTKIMKILCGENDNNTSVIVNGEPLQIVKQFNYLGALITDSGDDTPEIKRRIGTAKNATTSFTTIRKERS